MCIILYAVFFREIHSEFLCFNAPWDAARVWASVFLPSCCRLVGVLLASRNARQKAKGTTWKSTPSPSSRGVSYCRLVYYTVNSVLLIDYYHRLPG